MGGVRARSIGKMAGWRGGSTPEQRAKTHEGSNFVVPTEHTSHTARRKERSRVEDEQASVGKGERRRRRGASEGEMEGRTSGASAKRRGQRWWAAERRQLKSKRAVETQNGADGNTYIVEVVLKG